jgi:hypothetical protein
MEEGKMRSKPAAAIVSVAVTMLIAAAMASAEPSTLPPTWHVHNCAPGTTCTWPSAPVGFFPTILGGERLTAYLADPAMCPDATDKAFLGGGSPGPAADGINGNQPLREGVCMTSTTIIHLKSISLDQQAPDGWTYVSTANGFATYYKLTAIG